MPGQNEASQLVPCAVCGADDAQRRWECGSFGFVRCARCGHHYQNPQPDPNVLIARYDSEYLDYEVENDRNFLNLMLKGLSDVDFFERMATLHPNPSLLDIGCATGALLEHAKQRGYAVQGVEVCEPAARYGIEHRGVPISVGTLDAVRLTSAKFAAVHFSHLIEHLPDPRGFLLQVHRLMLPRALGVVVTPNADGLQARLFKEHWRSAIADHVHLFSARNLVRLLSETGFTVIAEKTWGGLGVGTAASWIKRPVDRLAKRLGFGDVFLALFTPTTVTSTNPEIDHS